MTIHKKISLSDSEFNGEFIDIVRMRNKAKDRENEIKRKKKLRLHQQERKKKKEASSIFFLRLSMGVSTQHREKGSKPVATFFIKVLF
jgi:hypothetical protein